MAIKHFGVVGHPIAHSKSPTLHRAAYAELGLDWEYHAYDVPQNGLLEFLTAHPQEFSGLSVTMPHKSEACELVHTKDTFAEITGAVNTLSSGGDQVIQLGPHHPLYGFNTDVYGIQASFAAAGITSLSELTILGSGSTATSALAAAHAMGAHTISIIARTPSAIERLVDLATQLGVTSHVFSFDNMHQAPSTKAVISTLPGTADLSIESLTMGHQATFLDVAYDPWPSARAQQWQDRGGAVISGLSMLAFQALIQVRIFVQGNPHDALPNESAVRHAMFASVGLGIT